MPRHVLCSSFMSRTHLASALGFMPGRPACRCRSAHGGGFASTAANAAFLNFAAPAFEGALSGRPLRGFGPPARPLRLPSLEPALPLRAGSLAGLAYLLVPLFRPAAAAFLPLAITKTPKAAV